MAKEVFAIIIKVLDDGTVTLTGPLDNKTLCYGLLEAAKDEVRSHCDKGKPVASTPKQLSFDIGSALIPAKR